MQGLKMGFYAWPTADPLPKWLPADDGRTLPVWFMTEAMLLTPSDSVRHSTRSVHCGTCKLPKASSTCTVGAFPAGSASAFEAAPTWGKASAEGAFRHSHEQALFTNAQFARCATCHCDRVLGSPI